MGLMVARGRAGVVRPEARFSVRPGRYPTPPGYISPLARTLADGPAGSLDELCDSVLARLDPPPRDDVALLLARTAPARAPD
jgi:hypothetical protein